MWMTSKYHTWTNLRLQNLRIISWAAHHGDVHDYLGMDLDYSETGKVKVSMIKYLTSLLQEFPEELGDSAASPAAAHLFQV